MSSFSNQTYKSISSYFLCIFDVLKTNLREYLLIFLIFREYANESTVIFSDIRGLRVTS